MGVRDMSDLIIRPILREIHPIHTGEYKIKTSIIEEVMRKIELAINFRIQGMIIYGPSGFGKSTAIDVIKKELSEKYFNHLLTYACTMPDPIKNEKEFYSRILKATGHQLYNKGTKDEKCDRLCSQLISLAHGEKENKKILLFIDEADALEKSNYHSLKDINNQLACFNIRMTTILIGTEDLICQRNLFVGKREIQILRRFMQKTYMFNGIKTKDDLEDILAAYDFGMKFPLDSECSFTQYFFPQNFKVKNYLHRETETLYQSLCNVYGQDVFSGHGLSMHILCLIVEYIFTKYGSDGTDEEWMSENNWLEAIEFADFSRDKK